MRHWNEIEATAKRMIGALLMTLFLLASNAPLLLAFEDSGSCTMACCRSKKKCCCRKPAARHSGLTISAPRACPPGCGQVTPFALQPPWLLSFPASGLFHLCVCAACLLLREFSTRVRLARWLRLLQRPPPPLTSC